MLSGKGAEDISISLIPSLPHPPPSPPSFTTCRMTSDPPCSVHTSAASISRNGTRTCRRARWGFSPWVWPSTHKAFDYLNTHMRRTVRMGYAGGGGKEVECRSEEKGGNGRKGRKQRNANAGAGATGVNEEGGRGGRAKSGSVEVGDRGWHGKHSRQTPPFCTLPRSARPPFCTLTVSAYNHCRPPHLCPNTTLPAPLSSQAPTPCTAPAPFSACTSGNERMASCT